MREIDEIIIHSSDSTFGNAALIDHWHRERGWDCIGYHVVILNGKISSDQEGVFFDGQIETGRSLDRAGAHCLGRNEKSIGVCLIGKNGQFTDMQIKTLVELIKKLRESFGDLNVSFHSDYNKDKPMCPGITAQDLLNG